VIVVVQNPVEKPAARSINESISVIEKIHNAKPERLSKELKPAIVQSGAFKKTGKTGKNCRKIGA
jgi:hypothetical protein